MQFKKRSKKAENRGKTIKSEISMRNGRNQDIIKSF